MNPTPLFRRLVYVLVMLGILAFSVAERDPAMLFVAGALTILSWFVVEGPNGKPLPGWMINIGALGITVWLARELWGQPGALVIAMGHFVTGLQVVLLFGRKTSRDYSVILVLGLLQFIGASVLTETLIFGVLLMCYGVVGLIVLVLFHLHTVSEQVRETTLRVTERKGRILAPVPRPVFGRGCGSDLRTAIFAVGVMCLAVGVGVFVLVPRSAIIRPNPYLGGAISAESAGYSNLIRLGSAPQQPSSRDVVMHATFTVNGRPATPPHEGWYLRGASLDMYDERGRLWLRGMRSSLSDGEQRMSPEGTLLHPGVPPGMVADITLRGGITRQLFTLNPTRSVTAESLGSILYNPSDSQVTLPDPWVGTLQYSLEAPDMANLTKPGSPQPWMIPPSRVYARGWRVASAQVSQLASEALAAKGLARNADEPPSERDILIAQTLADYLRTHYRYSLNAAAPRRDRDPIFTFLFESHEGHCELFASALGAMTRSLGMTARLATGYRVSEYNHIGGYYVARPEHAHAWVEVYCGTRGWVTVDATPPADESDTDQTAGVFAWFTQLYEYTEHAWFSSVIAFNEKTRREVLGGARTSVLNTVAAWVQVTSEAVINDVSTFLSNMQFDVVSLSALVFFGLGAGVGLVSLVRMSIVRRRRLIALHLDRMPRARRREMARQLRFYLIMLDMLEQQGHIKPVWQSPFAFAQSLAQHDPATFGAVLPVTEMFYEIRFGGRTPDRERLRWVDQQLNVLRQALLRRRVPRAAVPAHA